MTARFIRFGILAALLTLFAVQAGVAQDASGAPAADGQNEGIAVHGHWTITVVREGEVIARREFENALEDGGRAHLSELLSRETSAGPWIVMVEGDLSGTLCANNEIDNPHCIISESELELTVTRTGEHTILLEGAETAQIDSEILGVSTLQWFCDSSTASANCGPGDRSRDLRHFSRKILDAGIPVLTGDQIQVTVEISFS